MNYMIQNKVNKWVVIASILAILLLCSVTYICVSKYKSSKEAERVSLLQSGYETAVLQLMDSASSCQLASVHAGNVTMQLIDVSCLKTTNSTK